MSGKQDMNRGRKFSRKWLLWLPLIGYLIFLGAAYWRLDKPEQNTVPSRMIGQPVPGIDLPAASSFNPALSTKDMANGKPRLLNIFASWCIPCAEESPQLATLKARGVRIDGVAVRDAQPDVDRFLRRYGNPYDGIGLDARSALQFYMGSSGVPETFVIDGKGIIRYQHIGAIGPQDIDMILGKLKAAEG